jgi:corrinoid protein of di/trimethylamine methyltransferase
MSTLTEISELLQKGRAKEVAALVQQALDEGSTARQVLQEGLMPGMSVVGERFKNNEIYVPEVLIAARAMNAGIAVIRPLLVDEGVEATGTVVIGTVKGDLHDIGKNLVKMMMEGKGLNVVDLGTDVSPEQFVQAAQENSAQVIALSALLTTTMTEMKNVVEQAKTAGIRDTVRIMVGGAPVTDNYCESIGADAYAPDATSAAEKAIAFCTA